MSYLNSIYTATGLAAVTALMLACGGGGSSSGGSNTNSEADGTYTGTFNLVIESGDDIVIDSGELTLVVDGSRVSRDPSTDATGGSVVGDTVSIINSAAVFLSATGAECDGLIQQVGTINGRQIGGSILSSNLFCDDIPYNVSGSFLVELEE